MENFEVFLNNKWLKCPKPIISWYHSIVGITIKRLVHIAGLQINPSSQNLSSKLKSGPNYPVWWQLCANYKYFIFFFHLTQNIYIVWIIRAISVFTFNTYWFFHWSFKKFDKLKYLPGWVVLRNSTLIVPVLQCSTKMW